jgi:transmembrane sensor
MQKKLEKRYDISRIITKMAFDSATEEEKARLQAWLDESPLHHEEYKSWMQRLPEDLESKKTIDVRRAWKQFISYRRRRSMRVISRHWYVAAAAAAAIAVIVISVITMQNVEVPQKNELFFAAITKPIKTVVVQESGKKKAVMNDTILNMKQQSLFSDAHVESMTVTVPRNKTFKVLLADGSEVWLNTESRLLYPTRFTGNRREVELEGEAFFHVAHDAEHPFIVRTHDVETRVLGTRFNIRAYKGEQPHVTLVSGSVSVKSLPIAYSTVLSPGQDFSLTADGKPMVSAVDTEEYTAWVDGMFYFGNASLETIMLSIGRWYNVNIAFASSQAKSERYNFWGYRDDSIVKTVSLLNKIGNLNITYKDNTITISKEYKN